YGLCMMATDGYQAESCVTVSFNCEFIAAAQTGSLIWCRGEIVRKTGSMVFLRGEIVADEQILLTCSAVVKRLIPRD
ncbi:MAG: hypothetical protein KDI36_19160, partial [Pseudomonadales bacterium]|nr:hypothetical protein [Pseudomonadales bacterium]